MGPSVQTLRAERDGAEGHGAYGGALQQGEPDPRHGASPPHAAPSESAATRPARAPQRDPRLPHPAWGGPQRDGSGQGGASRARLGAGRAGAVRGGPGSLSSPRLASPHRQGRGLPPHGGRRQPQRHLPRPRRPREGGSLAALLPFAATTTTSGKKIN